MEALPAVTVGLLTVWDMLKVVAGKQMVIGEVLVEHKVGGKCGDFADECTAVPLPGSSVSKQSHK